VGSALQGTYTKKDGSTLKKIDANSDGACGFNYLLGRPQNLKFFESPIDLLSYLSIYHKRREKIGDTWFICLHGLKTTVVQNYFKLAQLKLTKEAQKQKLQANKLQEYVIRNFKSVAVCVDNDVSGLAFASKIQAVCQLFPTLNYELEIPKIPDMMKNQGIEKWDWNSELVFRVTRLSLKNQEYAQPEFVEYQDWNTANLNQQMSMSL